MEYYEVQYKKINHFGTDTSGPYRFKIRAKDLTDAFKQATAELIRVGMRSTTADVWDAKVIDLARPQNHHIILEEGAWKIDLNSGELLEEKV